MRCVNVLFLGLLSTAVPQAHADCRGFSVGFGECVEDLVDEISEFLLSTAQDIMPVYAGDVLLQWMYDLFFVPNRDILLTAYRFDELPIPSFCFGDFRGEKMKNQDSLIRHGCDFLPIVEDEVYGVFAASFSISPALQAALIPTGLWTIPRIDPVVPDICMAMRVPEKLSDPVCPSTTFGVSFNEQTLVVLTEALPITLLAPPFSIAADGILSFLTVIAESGLDQIAFAISNGNTGLQVPAFYFYDGRFVENDFVTHFYFSFKGSVELPFLPQGINDLMSIDGEYTNAYNFAGGADAVDTTLKAIFAGADIEDDGDIIKYYMDRLSGFQQVITTSARVHIDMRELTFGLLSGLNLNNLDLRMLMLPISFGRDQNAGLYLGAREEARAFQEIAQNLCGEFAGALRLVFGQGCPDFNLLGHSGKFGLSLRSDKTEFKLRWRGFIIECEYKIKNFLPKLTCNFNGVMFQVNERVNSGFSVGKVLEFGQDPVEMVADIPEDAVTILHGFTQEVASIAALASDSVETVVDSALSVFGLNKRKRKKWPFRRDLADEEEPLTRDSFDFDFVPGYTCEEPIELFDAANKANNPHYWEELGTDDSRASCLSQCYLFLYQDSIWIAEDTLPCCTYSEQPEGNSCSIGFSGTETVPQGSTTSVVSASTTFVDDFEKLTGSRDVGESCDEDGDCYLGRCGMGGYCYLECTPDFKCYPNQEYQKCRGNDDACLDIHNIFHYCDAETDTCVASAPYPSDEEDEDE